MRSAAASFVFGLLLLSAPAFAEPLTIEVTEAAVAYDARNSLPVVTFRLSEASRKAFADFSAQHVGEKIDLRIDGNNVMQTVIREPITGGVGQILAASHDGARQLTVEVQSAVGRRGDSSRVWQTARRWLEAESVLVAMTK